MGAPRGGKCRPSPPPGKFKKKERKKKKKKEKKRKKKEKFEAAKGPIVCYARKFPRKRPHVMC